MRRFVVRLAQAVIVGLMAALFIAMIVAAQWLKAQSNAFWLGL